MTERRTNPADPTAERTADQTTQSASGLASDERSVNERIRDQDPDDDLVPRNSEDAHATPRRYDTGE